MSFWKPNNTKWFLKQFYREKTYVLQRVKKKNITSGQFAVSPDACIPAPSNLRAARGFRLYKQPNFFEKSR